MHRIEPNRCNDVCRVLGCHPHLGVRPTPTENPLRLKAVAKISNNIFTKPFGPLRAIDYSGALRPSKEDDEVYATLRDIPVGVQWRV